MTDLIGSWMRGILAEVERIHPDLVARPPEDRWWRPIGAVQQCERCGTQVFPLEDHHGDRRWCQVGERPPDGEPVRLSFHTPGRCHRAPIDLAELLRREPGGGVH